MSTLIGNILTGTIDPQTGENVNYFITNTFIDGSAMNTSKCDGVIYINNGTNFFQRVIEDKPYINTKWFGAKGDGVTDDSAALCEAFYIAQLMSKDLYIPSGTYVANTPQTTKGISGNKSNVMYIDNSGIKKIKIFGEKDTKITTNSTSGTLILFYYTCQDCVIENIFFESTHAITTNPTCAIFLQGLKTSNPTDQGIKNFTIRNCRFEGYSIAVNVCGVNGLLIESCVFQSPLGHDNATNDTQPAVYLRFYDNGSQGASYDVKIINCIADGFTGNSVTTLTTKRPMDGFVTGAIYGLTYMNNTTRNFNTEHVLLGFPSQSNVGDSDKPLLISNNRFYGAIPIGSTIDGVNPNKSVTLIRCDAYNLEISNNQFYDVTEGVLIYPLDEPTLQGRDYRVHSNKFRSVRDTVNHIFQYAIFIQGVNSTGLRAQKVIVSDNYIDIDTIILSENRSSINIWDCENVIVENNKIFITNVDFNGYTFNGILYGRIDLPGLIDRGNKIYGTPTLNYDLSGMSSPPYITWDDIITTTISLTSSQILNLNTTPVQLLPAIGNSMSYVILDITACIGYVSSPYSTNTNLQIIYEGANYPIASDSYILSSTITKSGNISKLSNPTGNLTQTISNSPLLLTVQNGNPLNGNSTLEIYITYKKK